MVAANGIYKLAVIGTVTGQQHIHTLHFRSTVDPDGLAATEAAWQSMLIDAWQASARTPYRAIFYEHDNPVQQFQVRKVCGTAPLPAGVDEAEDGGSTVGTTTSTTEAAAPWLANNATWRTGLAGRRFRGRSFFGGMEETDLSTSNVNTARLTKTTTYCTALQTAFVTPADVDVIAKLFVYSRTQAVEFPATPCQNTGADVVSFQVRSALASMRSRKVGSGI